MIKKIIIFLLTLLLCFIPLANSVNATTQFHGVNIIGVVQAKSNWCWAACAEVCGKNVYPSSTRTQYSVVTFIKESTINEAGTLDESARGSQYVAYNNKTYSYTYSTWNFSQIVNSLKNGYAVQAGAGYYSGGLRTGGHMVVIYGTQFIDNSSGLLNYIDYFDPWDGTRHHCLFSEFCNGNYNNRIYDQTVFVI